MRVKKNGIKTISYACLIRIINNPPIKKKTIRSLIMKSLSVKLTLIVNFIDMFLTKFKKRPTTVVAITSIILIIMLCYFLFGNR